MRRTASLPDFKLTPLQGALIQAIEKDMDWGDVQALFDVALAAGMVQINSPWNEYGDGFLAVAIERAAYGSKGNKRFPEIDFLKFCLEREPEALNYKSPDGTSPVHHFLDKAWDRGDVHYRVPHLLPWWLNNAPREDLLNWRGSARAEWRDYRPARADGAYLLALALEASDKVSARPDVSLLAPLQRLGVDMNARIEDALVAGKIAYSEDWEQFLCQGGNPRLISNPGGDKPAPLWENLIAYGKEPLKSSVRTWCSQHLKNEIQQRDYETYWAELKNSVNHSPSPQEIVARLKKHPDFLSLRDPEGRSCMMYGIQMHASSWRTLSQKRFHELSRARDNKGLTLWHYALGKGKQFSSDMVTTLSDMSVPLDPSPATGRGLVAAMLLDYHSFGSSTDDMWVLSRTASATKALLKISTAHQWWAMPDEDVEPVINKILHLCHSQERGNYSSPSPEATLDLALREHVRNLHDPRLLGLAVALNLRAGDKKDIDLAVECLRRGAVLPDYPGLMDNLRQKTPEAQWQEIEQAQAKYQEGDRLDESTPAARISSRSPRF